MTDTAAGGNVQEQVTPDIVGKTIASAAWDTYESNYGPETALRLTFTDGTSWAVVVESHDD